MGKGEPGGTSKLILRAAMESGMGLAQCTCALGGGSISPGSKHSPECDVFKASEKFSKLLREEKKS